MADVDPEPYFVTIDDTLTGRRAGAGADRMAHELQQQAPVRTALARILGIHTDERAWSKGADGERLVAAQLTKLPWDEWFVFHDIPIGERDANVDHLVIGPGGVFSLNAKNHSGGRVWVAGNTLLVNGQRTAYLPKARAEAERVGRHLRAHLGREVPVRGVVVVIANELTMKEQPSGVDIVGRRDIARWLRRQKAVQSHADALGIAAMASRPTTWGR